MNVDKMRRASHRVIWAEEQRDRQAWLATLTPEHRAVHERGLGAICEPCVSEALRRMGRIAADSFGSAFSAGGVKP